MIQEYIGHLSSWSSSRMDKAYILFNILSKLRVNILLIWYSLEWVKSLFVVASNLCYRLECTNLFFDNNTNFLKVKKLILNVISMIDMERV